MSNPEVKTITVDNVEYDIKDAKARTDIAGIENLSNSTFYNTLIDTLYPVGSLYISMNDSAPFSRGTWTKVGAGKALVGVDTARYFFINKALDTQLDFDLSLARMKTNENPVFYIQYAYVRLNAILRKAGNFDIPKTFENINTDEEIMILRHISQFPTVVAECAKKRAPNKMCNYIYTLAKLVNSYYVSHNVLNSDENIKNERLALIKSIQITMENAFDLIGIEAIKEM